MTRAKKKGAVKATKKQKKAQPYALNVRGLTHEQKNLLKRAAKARGVTLSDWVRMILIGAAKISTSFSSPEAPTPVEPVPPPEEEPASDEPAPVVNGFSAFVDTITDDDIV